MKIMTNQLSALALSVALVTVGSARADGDTIRLGRTAADDSPAQNLGLGTDKTEDTELTHGGGHGGGGFHGGGFHGGYGGFHGGYGGWGHGYGGWGYGGYRGIGWGYGGFYRPYYGYGFGYGLGYGLGLGLGYGYGFPYYSSYYSWPYGNGYFPSAYYGYSWPYSSGYFPTAISSPVYYNISSSYVLPNQVTNVSDLVPVSARFQANVFTLPHPQPVDGTFKYDGGPAPLQIPQPSINPSPTVDRAVSIPAALPKYRFPSFGEKKSPAKSTPLPPKGDGKSLVVKAY